MSRKKTKFQLRSWTKSLGMGATVGVVSASEEWPWKRREETSFTSFLGKRLLTWTGHGIPTRKGECGELLLLSSAIILLYFQPNIKDFFLTTSGVLVEAAQCGEAHVRPLCDISSSHLLQGQLPSPQSLASGSCSIPETSQFPSGVLMPS